MIRLTNDILWTCWEISLYSPRLCFSPLARKNGRLDSNTIVSPPRVTKKCSSRADTGMCSTKKVCFSKEDISTLIGNGFRCMMQNNGFKCYFYPMHQDTLPTKNANRLDFIDALRGFAALYVLVYHTAMVPKPTLTVPHWLEPLIHNGGTGVTLFFVISAFTLCYTLDGRQRESLSTRKFYIRRIFRIVPLYYLWLLFMVFYWWGYPALLQHKGDLLLYSTFTYNFVPGQQYGLVWASWTLGIEMVFYALFPFLFRLVTNLRRSVVFFGLSMALAFAYKRLMAALPEDLTEGHELYFSFFTQVPVFAVGIITYFLYRRMEQCPLPNWVGPTGLALSSAGVFALPYLAKLNAIPMAYAISVLYAGVLLSLSLYPIKVLVNRITVFLGLISYSLYLNHPIIVANLSEVYQYIYGLGMGISFALLACVGLTIAIISGISYLTYKLIEKPGMELGRRIIKGMTLRAEKKNKALVLERQY